MEKEVEALTEGFSKLDVLADSKRQDENDEAEKVRLKQKQGEMRRQCLPCMIICKCTKYAN